jgi:hypothetical protein
VLTGARTRIPRVRVRAAGTQSARSGWLPWRAGADPGPAERRLDESPGTIRPAQLAVRDLELIDGTMAILAQDLG